MTIRFIIKNVPATGRKGHHRKVAKVRTSIYVRIRDGREIDYIARTGLLVYPKWWNRTREELNASSACPENERLMTNNKIIGLRNYLTQKYIDDRTRGLPVLSILCATRTESATATAAQEYYWIN